MWEAAAFSFGLWGYAGFTVKCLQLAVSPQVLQKRILQQLRVTNARQGFQRDGQHFYNIWLSTLEDN